MRTAGLEHETEVQGGSRVAERPPEQDGARAGVQAVGIPLDGPRPVPFDARMLLGLQAAAGNGAVSALIAESRSAPASAPVPIESGAVAGAAPVAPVPSEAEAAAGEAGGGGVPIEEQPVPATPSLRGLDPGQALAVASGLPAGQLLGALTGVADSVDQAVAGEDARLVRDPPTRARHPGAPSTVESPASQRIPLGSGGSPRTVPRVRESPEVAIRRPPSPASAPPLPTALAVEPTFAGGAAGGELSAGDKQQIATAIAGLPTRDAGVGVSPGPLPQLPLAGSADPNQVHRQRAHLDQALAVEHSEGRRDAGAPLGEAEIFPTAPPETLTGHIDVAQAAAADGAPGADETDGAVSLIAQQEKGSAIQSAAGAGMAGLAAQRQGYAERTAQERANSDREMTEFERVNIADQAGERGAAQHEVLGMRRQWTQEQQQLVDRASDESSKTTTTALETAATTRSQAEEEAASHYAAGQAEAERARHEGDQQAAAERGKAQAQGSGGFLGFLASAARSLFDAARHAVQAAFDRARQLVRDAIERAHQLALAAMERARQAIVGAIRLAGDALTAIGDRVLVAFPALRDRFRRAIQERVARAEAAVNRLASGLKRSIQNALNLLGAALAAAVGALRRGMHAVVASVRSAVQGAVDFARNAIAGLGTFAVLVRDVAANPVRWLANLAAAAQDGIRNHLWPDLKLSVKAWFSEKVESILGLGTAAWGLLRKGGITTMQVAGMAWDGLKSMIPQAIVWVLIEKLVALIVPAAAAVMLIIQALQAAWGSVGRILQAFDAFMAFLKGVRWGNAGPLFGKAVAAGAVAVIEFVSQFLLQRLMGAAGKVAGKLRSMAKRIGARLASTSKKVTSSLSSLTGQARKKWFLFQERGSVRRGMAWIDANGDHCIRYGPTNRGPLEADVANSFRSSSYTSRKLAQPKELWRVYSNPKMKLGAYWSDVPPSGPVQATVDSALHHTFQNAATLVVHIRVPAGTTIFEGIAGPKEGLIGGGPQFLVRKRLPSWEV